MPSAVTDHAIHVSEKAADAVKRFSEREGYAAPILRVAVQGGGCSGLTYKLNLGAEVKDGDKVFEEHGITVVADFKSLVFLVGMHLDFSDGLNGKGFTFNNPNATKTCGCGTSFSA